MAKVPFANRIAAGFPILLEVRGVLHAILDSSAHVPVAYDVKAYSAKLKNEEGEYPWNRMK